MVVIFKLWSLLHSRHILCSKINVKVFVSFVMVITAINIYLIRASFQDKFHSWTDLHLREKK